MKSLGLFMTHGMSLEKWHKAGSLRRELALYAEHARNGVRTTLVSYGGAADLQLAADFPFLTVLVNRYRLPRRLYAALVPYLHLNRLKGVELIKTNQLAGAGQAVTAARLLKVPAVLRQGYNLVEHTALGKGVESRRYRRAVAYERKWLSQADLCQFTTQDMQDDCLRRLGAAAPRQLVVPNYIVGAFWDPPFDRFRDLQANDTFRIGFWGRLARQKNLDSLVAACSGLNVELLLAGDGPERRTLEQHARSLQVKVTFMGTVSHETLARSMAECDAFAIASHLEGHPKALIEAMFFGMPIIAADSPGIGQLVVDGETAVVSQSSVAALRSAIQRMRGLTADQRRMLASNARALARRNYSLEAVSRQELDAYEQLLRRGARDRVVAA